MKTIRRGCAFLGCLFLTLSLSAQIHTLTSFDYTDGAVPDAALLQGSDGDLYGTTSAQGQGTFGGGGTLFKMTLRGAVTTLYNFCTLSQCVDGEAPVAGQVQARDGSLWTTSRRGLQSDRGHHFPIYALRQRGHRHLDDNLQFLQ